MLEKSYTQGKVTGFLSTCP